MKEENPQRRKGRKGRKGCGGREGRLVAVDRDDLIQQVVLLAEQIWGEHYPAIIGEQQVTHMLGKFQSFAAIRRQIDKGMEYYLLLLDDEYVGYFAARLEVEGLFLSKLYVKGSHAGKGLGSQLLEFVQEHWNAGRVRLTVNKENQDSIRFYENRGFSKTGEVVLDIGGGFVMDDYQMERTRVE